MSARADDCRGHCDDEQLHFVLSPLGFSCRRQLLKAEKVPQGQCGGARPNTGHPALILRLPKTLIVLFFLLGQFEPSTSDTGPQQNPFLPAVPTIKEVGYLSLEIRRPDGCLLPA
jgi:hypothetical protein